ncbi:unnamed protein product, partial [Effrenium voratum]
AEAVVCLFDEVAHGERLVSRFGTHAVPIFWGHGGSYRVDRILPAEHEHYQAPVLLEHLRQVRARSRRHARARPVVLLQLAEAEPPMGRLGAPEEPCHPAECSEHEWQTEIRRRVADECQRGKDEGLTPDALKDIIALVGGMGREIGPAKLMLTCFLAAPHFGKPPMYRRYMLGWYRPSAILGLLLLSFSLAVAPVLKVPRESDKGFRRCADAVEPTTKLVGLTRQEVAFAEEVLERDAEEQLVTGEDAGVVWRRELRLLQEAVEADDVEALPGAIRAAEAAGVAASELAFAEAVLAQRVAQRRQGALEALRRVTAGPGPVEAVRIRCAVLMARAAGVSREDLRRAEELRSIAEFGSFDDPDGAVEQWKTREQEVLGALHELNFAAMDSYQQERGGCASYELGQQKLPGHISGELAGTDTYAGMRAASLRWEQQYRMVSELRVSGGSGIRELQYFDMAGTDEVETFWYDADGDVDEWAAEWWGVQPQPQVTVQLCPGQATWQGRQDAEMAGDAGPGAAPSVTENMRRWMQMQHRMRRWHIRVMLLRDVLYSSKAGRLQIKHGPGDDVAVGEPAAKKPRGMKNVATAATSVSGGAGPGPGAVMPPSAPGEDGQPVYLDLYKSLNGLRDASLAWLLKAKKALSPLGLYSDARGYTETDLIGVDVQFSKDEMCEDPHLPMDLCTDRALDVKWVAGEPTF